MAAEKIAEKFDRYVIRCGSKIGDIMSEMEKFMHIDGVYAEYLMFFDDLAFDLGLCCIDGFIAGAVSYTHLQNQSPVRSWHMGYHSEGSPTGYRSSSDFRFRWRQSSASSS